MIDAKRSLVCECGCGQPIPPSKNRWHPTRFLVGHGARGRSYPHRIRVPTEAERPSGLCECGCGRPTPIAKHTNSARRLFAGCPTPFIQGHRKQPAMTEHWHFTGRRKVHGYVYVYRPEHPDARTDSLRGFIVEHRVVMEEKLGRRLAKSETVHHINGKTDDNHPDNLELRQGKHGAGVVMECADCGSRNIKHVRLAPQ